MKKNYVRTLNRLLGLTSIAGILLIVLGVYTGFAGGLPVGIASVIIGLLIIIRIFIFYKTKETEENEIVNMISGDRQVNHGNVLTLFPMPICILHITGDIVWYNEEMTSLTSTSDLYGMKIDKIMPGLKWGSVIKSGKVDRTIEYREKQYNVKGAIIADKDKTEEDKDKYSVYLYFIDKTKEIQITRKYLEERYDVAVISIDNYDYLLQKTDDSQGQDIIYQVNQFINAWIRESGGVLKKIDRDKYFAIFEHKYLDIYIDKKFEVLIKVRELSENVKLPVSITMGIGTGGNITENEADARHALDMAIGRGGDMVAVKEPTQYKFYGSKNREYDKSTKAKARAAAMAIRSFIDDVENVVIMGHTGMDFDCFGAAMGMQRAARCAGKQPYIICDNMSGVKKMVERVNEVSDYQGMLISPEQAETIVDKNTMIVIVDTHRPSLIPCPKLLEKTDRIIMIDHHRRSTDFITPVSLTHHEPYASSTCEMVTELLQFMNVGESLTNLEAQCLYMGILMDTKNFILKTGVRTFEAASYLRRYGLDTVAVKQMFAVDKAMFDERSEIVSGMKRVFDNIAISVCQKQFDNMRVIASQAADEMMNIENIEASFVVYPMDSQICISGRSLGEVNVQEILEKLGGGGHLTGAGAQLSGYSYEKVEEMLLNAIGDYIFSND